MLETTPLRQQIARDVFDYQQLVACLSQFSKPRDKIRRLLASGEIVRIRKGLYAFGESLRRAPISRELAGQSDLWAFLHKPRLRPELPRAHTGTRRDSHLGDIGAVAHLHYALRNVLLPSPESEPLRPLGAC